MKVLDALGFGAALRGFSCEPPDLVSLSWKDASLRLRQTLGRGAGQRYGAPYLMAHRADLYQLLVDALPAGA